jgi:hypothetical protein
MILSTQAESADCSTREYDDVDLMKECPRPTQGTHHWAAVDSSTKRSEGRAHLRGEELGLFPSGEVTAAVHLVVVDEV